MQHTDTKRQKLLVSSVWSLLACLQPEGIRFTAVENLKIFTLQVVGLVSFDVGLHEVLIRSLHPVLPAVDDGQLSPCVEKQHLAPTVRCILAT